MKKFVLALVLPLVFLACNPENQLPVDNGESGKTPADTVAPKPVLVAPSNLRVDVQDGIKAVLSWENESTDYDGVEIQKAGTNGKYKIVGNKPAGTLTHTDEDFTENGQYSYRLCSYKGNTYSDYASVSFTIDGIPDPAPQVSVTSVETAPNMIVVRYTITDDLGGSVKNGVVWTTDGTEPILDASESYPYWKNLRTDGNGIGVIMNPEGPVKLRAYAKSIKDGKVGYSAAQAVSPAEEEPAYEVSYTDVTPSDLPSEIKVYKASTSVTGRPTNIWYAIADLSTGKVELRVLGSEGSKKKTSVMAKEQVSVPYVFTNGGYFGGSNSVSYILDKGKQIAENESYLSRKKSYYVSRGVFGVTSTGVASVNWRFGRAIAGGPYFYDTPIPQIDGAPEESPSSKYPSPAINPGYYSALGGGPVLVKDGRTKINFLMLDDVYLSNFELFPSDIFNKTTRQPRTAVGRTADGKVVLMVVDGRKSGVSEGVVLTDMARLMRGVGCVDVLNLDGGGSSCFLAGQNLNVLNNPSDGTERAVVSVIGFAKAE